MNVISLTLGDWSHDGHGMSEAVWVECNLTRAKLEAAYEAGTKAVGLDLSEDVCSDYEDPNILEEDREILAETGCLPEGLDEEYVTVEQFAEIWMRIARLGNPTLSWKFLKNEGPNINIGGYGLFSQ